jgi:hypothetical protein
LSQGGGSGHSAILQQLAEIGLVFPGEVSIDELVAMRSGAIFMPHGLGHNVGGYLPGHEEHSLLAG